LVFIALYLLWHLFNPAAEVTRGDAKLLVDRMWFEKLSKDPRELSHNLYLMQVRRPKAQLGVVGHSSAYRHSFDVVNWKLDGTQLTLEILQAKKKVTLNARTWRCPKEAPTGLDLCLELSHGDKTLRYYSAKKWRAPPNLGIDFDSIEAVECEDCEDATEEFFESFR
jgi:hypothetical protein